MNWIFILALLFCNACEQPSQAPPWRAIAGRDPATKQPIYRARVPLAWQCVDPAPGESLADTTKPICRILIADPVGQIEITIHNFPTDTIDQRVPPQAQVARWQRQIAERASSTDMVRPFAHGGFVGLAYEADGLLAWTQQLSLDHYRTLSQAPDSRLKQQMRADYTIKATGPESAISRHREQIQAFARSFELIDEIPAGDEIAP